MIRMLHMQTVASFARFARKTVKFALDKIRVCELPHTSRLPRRLRTNPYNRNLNLGPIRMGALGGLRVP